MPQSSINRQIKTLVVCLILMPSVAFGNTKAHTTPGMTSIPKQVIKQMLGISWHKECPVPLHQLAYLRLPYYGYDHKTHHGYLIINKKIAADTLTLFQQLYRAHFPIQVIRPYSSYAVGKYAAHNATVGFYCRPAQNQPNIFSRHAYGVAIDINPRVNPYLWKGVVWPRTSKRYLKRSSKVTGLITVHSTAFKIFTSHGWEWGGLWHDSKDYMHFQKLYGTHYVIDKMHYITPQQRISGLPQTD